MWLNKIDPMFALVKLIHRGFFSAELKLGEIEFILSNARKHANALWVMAVMGVCAIVGLVKVPADSLGTVVTGLLGPVMVLGGAWFAISFGGVPARLLDIAMTITAWMLSAFLTSFAVMAVTIAFITSPWIWPAIGMIFSGTVVSCFLYDTSDGLKAGLDEAQLRHSRAALAFYLRQGITPEDETH